MKGRATFGKRGDSRRCWERGARGSMCLARIMHRSCRGQPSVCTTYSQTKDPPRCLATQSRTMGYSLSLSATFVPQQRVDSLCHCPRYTPSSKTTCVLYFLPRLQVFLRYIYTYKYIKSATFQYFHLLHANCSSNKEHSTAQP